MSAFYSTTVFFDGTIFKKYVSYQEYLTENEENDFESSEDRNRNTSDEFWKENNQWPGLDPCDYLGG